MLMILIIEDSEADAELVIEAIRAVIREETRIARANTPTAAKQALQRQRFDLIVMDLHLTADGIASLPYQTWWDLHDCLPLDRTLIASGYLDEDEELLYAMVNSGARFIWRKPNPLLVDHDTLLKAAQFEILKVLVRPPMTVTAPAEMTTLHALHRQIEELQNALWRGNGHSILTKIALIEERVASIDDRVERGMTHLEGKLDAMQPSIMAGSAARWEFRGIVWKGIIAAVGTIAALLLGWWLGKTGPLAP